MAFARPNPVPPENAMNAVIYARYSSVQQTENSIDGQLRECNRFAEFHGYTVIGTYVDRARSGTSVEDRTEFLKIIDDAKKQQFAFVIVYRFDRFARNRYDSVIYKKKLSAFGVRVISTAETIGDGDESIILESIYEAMDEAYSRRLSTITKRGLRETALKNQWTTSPPFGYEIVDRHLEIIPKEAEAVRMIFEKYTEGATKKEIANELKGRGLKTKHGGDFDYKKLNSIMTNKTYTGISTYMGVERTCPAIISTELYEAVQKKLQANAKQYGRKTEKTHYALCGKLYCGYCGQAMYGDMGTSRNGTRYSYYSCPSKRQSKSCQKKSERQDFIEWYICEQTVKYVLTDERIKEIAVKVEELSRAELENGELAELQKRRKALDREFDDCAEALIKSKNQRVIDKINERSENLEKEINAVEAEIAKMQLRAEQVVTADFVEKYLNAFKGKDLLDENYRERIINTLIQCVYLYDDKIVVYFNLKGQKMITRFEAIRESEEMCSDSFALGELEILQNLVSNHQRFEGFSLYISCKTTNSNC